MFDLKEYKLPFESFVAGWYIPEHVCDGVIQYYYEHSKDITKGVVGGDTKTPTKVDTEIKDSFDLSVPPNENDGCVMAYRTYLDEVLQYYVKKYKYADNNFYFGVYEDYNIQRYKVGGGFKKWHHERTQPRVSTRQLVFMTYLNDVEDGGTEFFYQKIKTQAKKGLTLIWPTDFTHTHRGIVSNNNEKYICTGWFTMAASIEKMRYLKT